MNLLILWVVQSHGIYYAIDSFETLAECKKAAIERKAAYDWRPYLVCLPSGLAPTS